MSLLKGKSKSAIEFAFGAVTVLALVPIVLTFIYIIYKGLPAMSMEFLTEMPRKGMRQGGIFPAIIGSLYLTLGTIVVSVPIGIITGVYLVEYAEDNFFTRLINVTIINLAGIPSIIYGLFGMALFVITLNFGVSIKSGVLTLGIMCLPVIITSTREALLAVPNTLREASLALGGTKFETIIKIILPASLSGILTGVVLSISRAAGETAPIMFTAVAFSLPFLPESINDQVMALPYHLYVISTQVSKMPANNIFGTLFVLVFISVSFNIIGNLIKSFGGKDVR